MYIFFEALKILPGDFKCTYTDNPHHALEMLKFLTPDFIISDFNLPQMDGLTVYHEIMKHQRLKTVPFFLYSSKVNNQMKAEAIKLGASGVIEKPESIQKMKTVLEDILLSEYFHH